MTESILQVVHEVMSSPWVYLALFLLAATDAFLPAVPSESVVITAGVFAAASGSPQLVLVVLAAAAGALVGDHISYAIGRGAGGRLLARARPGSRRRRAFDRAADALAERGSLVLVVARYVPGGRTAVTVTMGALGYPRRTFTRFDILAALSWAVYSVLVGYIGGMAFENDPIKGVVLGIALALGVTALVEVARYARRKRRLREAESRDELLVPAADQESARTP
ncbi:DedA family protein [Actinopolymorpha singaporensis]|uniref:Membrane protein DedA, SNARE-associated domain n=1 Tax=Actinopolymorpha singaporensis TaxID=117157 RepID=A0A1H1X9C7_9ACTN|nr:VTT domain-containing protein [Actinopolymorpha singaporensis]SDT05670.1 membrane protein DedA, SNARE-associated domain [Actinopolymorpha singaporensis]